MSEPRPVARLGWVVIPIAILPLALQVWPIFGRSAFGSIVAVSIAAPALGFWLGEVRGQTGPGRAALGCVFTLGTLLAYGVLGFLLSRFVID